MRVALLVAGAVAALIALTAWYADHRRWHRRDPDAVGCMPWTALFMLALLAATVLVGAALRS